MQRSTDRLLTTHAGSLPRPDALIAANRARDASAADEREFGQTLGAAVGDVVRRQHDLGIDVPGDGEFGKSMAQSVNYGSWWRYSWQRLSGIAPGEQTLYEMAPHRSHPGAIVRQWTRERSREAMRAWRARYGAAPSSCDWSRTHARRRGGEPLKRLQTGEWPAPSTVIDLYGSWAAAVADAFAGA